MYRIKQYLKQHRARFVQELCDYICFSSVSAGTQNKKDVTACAKWLADHCRKIGLEVKIVPTGGNPIVIARTPRSSSRKKPHYLVYGHYDVQPADPLNLWKSPPFEPRIKSSALFARGASDNKGQHFAHLKAVEAYLKTGTDLPCNLTFLIEGEEEIGSTGLARFLHDNQSRLQCDAVVISDTELYSLGHPTLSYGLRGICGVQIALYGADRDLHSGIFGGSIDNPAMALCQMLAQLRDKKGRVTIPGFYEDVLPLSPFERANFLSHPFNERAYTKAIGVPRLFGEIGFTPLERRSARPTLEINGLTSGYQGDGSKTIIPSSAHAKITMRLVPHQESRKILTLAVSHLKKLCPATVRMEISAEPGGEPYLISPKSDHIHAALGALREAFDGEPLLSREGGSIPIVNEFKRSLKVDVLLLGLALPDDNAHSPNEKFDLNVFAKGMLMSAYLWQRLSQK